MVKGFEYKKGQYVVFTDEELKALDEKATNGLEITEFLPKDASSPSTSRRPTTWARTRAARRATRCWPRPWPAADEIALAKYAARGKSYLVLIRSTGDRLFMQQLYHSDEVRDIGEVPVETRRNSEAEVKLARQLIDQITSGTFKPDKYEDEVRKRVEALIAQKLKGKDITAEKPSERPPGQVIDLMEALKASLAKGGRAGTKAAARQTASPGPARRPCRRRLVARLRAVAGGRKK
jgi:DNA end-binding protein Ku